MLRKGLTLDVSATCAHSFMEKLISNDGRKSQELHTPIDITHTQSVMATLGSAQERKVLLSQVPCTVFAVALLFFTEWKLAVEASHLLPRRQW